MNGSMGTWGPFEPDEMSGFERSTIALGYEDDGDICATLVRCQSSASDSRPAVLYVHGFVDYFFQEHLAKAFEDAGFRFYALELRRYGRSLRPNNRPNFALDVQEYFPEITASLEEISRHHVRVAGIVAHSTGALIAVHYLCRVRPLPRVGCLVLNSPFFHFGLPPVDRIKLWTVVRLAKLLPKVVLPERINPLYGRTIHKSQEGEWDYDLEKKPLAGFPLYSGWFRMIKRAQDDLVQLRLDLPILGLHSSRSKRPGVSIVPEDLSSDTVLDVKDMKELTPKLGPRVTMRAIEGGMHDLLLSPKPARDEALSAMVDFVSSVDRAAEQSV